jgi:hypothetical protein
MLKREDAGKAVAQVKSKKGETNTGLKVTKTGKLQHPYKGTQWHSFHVPKVGDRVYLWGLNMMLSKRNVGTVMWADDPQQVSINCDTQRLTVYRSIVETLDGEEREAYELLPLTEEQYNEAKSKL